MTRASPAFAPDPSDCLSVRNGRLFVEECDAMGLVERFGSPLFVTSEAQLRANYRRCRDAFARAWPEGPVDVLPAFKANTTLATRHILSAEGAGADVYSPQELTGVLGTGVEPARVSVNGGGKEWLPEGYVQHERVFVFPDAVLAVLLTASAVLLLTDQPLGRSLSLVCAGMLAFLGLLDAAYFWQTGVFARGRGGVANATVVAGLLAVSLVLLVVFV
jgi:hypothetical protein